MSDPTFALPADPSKRPDHKCATRVVIVGGGPGGYEAALVGAQLGAEVSIVEQSGLGGSAVLTDVVPSKTLIATADVLDVVSSSARLGVRTADGATFESRNSLSVDFGVLNAMVKRLAAAQSRDIRTKVAAAGVAIYDGKGRLAGPSAVTAHLSDGTEQTLQADVVLLSVGARPRELPDAKPDGKRILTWTQLYELDEKPEHLIVVGSGVTGAEFASAYHALGSKVTLVSSRERVLPGSDTDAADVLQEVFESRGVNLMPKTRAQSAVATEDGVVVTLTDGREIEGSHVLTAVGSVPATQDLGLDEAGVDTSDAGHIEVDRVSRTSVRGVYAAGDCTGVLPLASVAAMQGRIAMNHALGDAVTPLLTRTVASAVFTSPEIATVGYTEEDVEAGLVDGEVVRLTLATNPRAKMQGISEGFVKLIARRGSGSILGAVVVSPRASELIHSMTLAITARMNVDQIAQAFTIYPSLTGSIAETARIMHSTMSD